MNELTQAQFYAAMLEFRKDLSESFQESHSRLRVSIEDGLNRIETRMLAHEREEALVAKDVEVLKDARREEQRRAGLRTTFICAIATAAATLTVGLLHLLRVW